MLGNSSKAKKHAGLVPDAAAPFASIKGFVSVAAKNRMRIRGSIRIQDRRNQSSRRPNRLLTRP